MDLNYKDEIMEYRIKRILHAGSEGVRGTERTDGRYPLRIGRTINLDIDSIKIGQPFILWYLKNADGSDYSNKWLPTSNVVGIHGLDGAFICVETLNSIYEFEAV